MPKDAIVESYRIKGETFTVTGGAIDSGTYKTVYKMTSATGKAMVLKIEKPHGGSYSQASLLINGAYYNNDLNGDTQVFPGDSKTPTRVVEPFVEGKPLREFSFSSKSQFLEVCYLIFMKLHEIHIKKGIVIGDVSPNNIIIDDKANKPVVKIIDFDEARQEGEETLGKRSSYQPEELATPAPAEFRTDNLSALIFLPDIFPAPDIAAECKAFSNDPELAASALKLSDKFKHLHAVDYFISQQDYIYQLGFFLAEYDELFHLKRGITDFNQLVAVMKQIKSKYHNDFFTNLGSTFFKELLSKDSKGLDDFLSILSNNSLAFIIQATLPCEEEKNHLMPHIQPIFDKDPEKLIHCLQCLGHQKAPIFFTLLQFTEVDLEQFSQKVYKKMHHNFEMTYQFFDDYCKRNPVLYQRVLLVCKQTVYKPYLENRQNQLCCLNAFFSKSAYEKKYREVNALTQLTTSTECKAIRQSTNSKKLKSLAHRLVEATAMIEAADIKLAR